MKKILIVCILAIGMMANAQAPQLIAKPLKLTSVGKGTAADSVLVLGADKIMKFVPRSAFGGGSGTDKSFQEILNQPWDNFIHTFSGGLKFENPYASVLAYRDGIIIERTNLTSTPTKAELFSEGIAFTDSFGNRSYTKYPNNATIDKTFAVSVNGNYADANGNITINSSPYWVYTAILSQNGTNAPVATVLENTFGDTVTWTRLSSGQYRGSFSNASFQLSKFFAVVGRQNINTLTRLDIFGDSSIFLGTATVSGAQTTSFSDNLMFNTCIEIRVYK